MAAVKVVLLARLQDRQSWGLLSGIVWSQDGGIRSPSREGLAGRSPKEDPNFAYPAAHDELVCGASNRVGGGSHRRPLTPPYKRYFAYGGFN
jgi:hypothetical protein